jgi:hypothetical protein
MVGCSSKSNSAAYHFPLYRAASCRPIKPSVRGSRVLLHIPPHLALVLPTSLVRLRKRCHLVLVPLQRHHQPPLAEATRVVRSPLAHPLHLLVAIRLLAHRCDEKDVRHRRSRASSPCQFFVAILPEEVATTARSTSTSRVPPPVPGAGAPRHPSVCTKNRTDRHLLIRLLQFVPVYGEHTHIIPSSSYFFCTCGHASCESLTPQNCSD